MAEPAEPEQHTTTTKTFFCSQVTFDQSQALVQGTLQSDPGLAAYTIQFACVYTAGSPFTEFTPGKQYDVAFTERP